MPMDSTVVPRPRPRPAHTQGTTRCAYTTDGSRLVTVGSNNTIRLYKTGSDGEPTNIDDCQEQSVAVAASHDFFVVGCEDGTVSQYSLSTASFQRFLVRTSLPVRDVALSADAEWCAVASDELTVKIVNVQEPVRVKHLREHGRASRHVSLDPNGRLAAVSCVDGIIYVYSLTAEEPQLIRKIDGIIGAVEGDFDVSTRVVWHPDGRAFAVPTPMRDVQVVSKNDWEKQRCFANGHFGDITAVAWSPNGAMLATACKGGKVLIWETKTQSVIQRHDFSNVIDLAWHPSKNILSFTTTDGEVYIYPDFLTDQFSPMLKMTMQPSPFIHDPLSDQSTNKRAGARPVDMPTRPRRPSLGSNDSFLADGDYDDDGFVVDDDGAGYAAGGQKRSREDDGDGNGSLNKRRHVAEPHCHGAFQPGSTPWRGNRKYLCLNLIGFVWTVDQDSHHTVTVEFYDHAYHRDFHFTDTFLYDKACLNHRGTLFSCPPRDDGSAPATIFYRPHQTWTQRTDWRTQLPRGEAITAMSLSDSFITVTTTANYVRVFTLFGVPFKVYRPKSTPTVTCASWRDYLLTVGNGPVGPDGTARLLYTIENIKRDEVCQNEDTVALPEGATLKNVFFSDAGDPCIYDSTGTLLTLLHWRRPSQASWIPLLDTTLLPRLASGRKHETYFSIAVAENKFHCIILKGGDQYPYFPRPLLSEFDLSIPLTAPPLRTTKKKPKNDDAMDRDDDYPDGSASSEEAGEGDDDGAAETRRLEQELMLKSVLAAQLRDLVDATAANHATRSLLSRTELDVDKTLLQLLAVECREGEDRGMRALEMVHMMRDRSGRMMDAASKIAERYGRALLRDKIREIGEKRVAGDDDAQEEDGQPDVFSP